MKTESRNDMREQTEEFLPAKPREVCSHLSKRGTGRTLSLKPPAFQFYPDDFISGTFAMTDEEVGQYMRLLCKQWNHGSIDPNSAAENIRSATVSPRVLAKFRKGQDGLLRNLRMEQERRKQAKYRQQQSLKGQASAKARFNRGSTVVQPKVNQRLEPEGNSPSPSPSPSSVLVQPTNQRRPNLSEVKAKCQFAGWPEAAGERFWHHFESSGWIDKNGHEVRSWESKLALWVTDERARPAEDAHHVNGANTVILGKELERVIERMKTIKGTYGDHQTWDQGDVDEFNRLRIRRNELRKTLGVQV